MFELARRDYSVTCEVVKNWNNKPLNVAFTLASSKFCVKMRLEYDINNLTATSVKIHAV